MSIVEIEGLTFSYSRKEEPVINDFSFSMEKGEIVGILGQSGSGKSTITPFNCRTRNADERNH